MTSDHAQYGMSVTLFASVGAFWLETMSRAPQLIMSIGALLGGVAALLPALSGFLDRRQARRQAAAEFSRRGRAE